MRFAVALPWVPRSSTGLGADLCREPRHCGASGASDSRSRRCQACATLETLSTMVGAVIARRALVAPRLTAPRGVRFAHVENTA